uniref:Cadherin domain-containing protein n=1 Tax=Octopus bimaculoides TaxID=37653 RepID=A0A0L8H7U2_OCTBM
MLLMIMLVLLMANRCWCVDHIFHVKENNDRHSYIGDIVSDTNLLDNIQSQDDSNKFSFKILQHSTDRDVQLFNVTSGGQLYTAVILDAETLCQYNVECFRILEIAVQHGHSFIKLLEIKVMIEDVNDNYPIFPDKEFHILFDESTPKGIKEIIPNAFDKDVTIQNSNISYQLRNNQENTFQLSVSKVSNRKSKIELLLVKRLDRERKETYNLQIIATDGGSHSKKGLMDLRILVEDKNDNAPVFSQNIYKVTVNETQERTKPIVILSAMDLDKGDNGAIVYNFSPLTSEKDMKFFILNQTSGELFLKKEFQFRKFYEVFIEASDKGKPPMTSVVTVLINGMSHLNNPPNIDVKFILESTGNTAVISEGTQIHSFVAYVKVTDNDSGVNGQVKCHLQNKYLKLISLSGKKYKVVVKSEIDRESEKRLNFTIKCQDNSLPPLTVEKQFSMLVTDINDVQPQFIQDIYKFLTYENEHKDFPVGYVDATDPDTGDGGQLTYSLLTNGKDTLPFQISDVGFISTTESLDREEKNMYEFKVLVKDKGTPSLENTANVVVEVIDLNDNAPYFSFPNVNPFSLNVHYHPRSDHDITVVRASDRDSQHNAFLTYEILRGNEKNLFEMNHHSGALSFSRSPYQNDAGFYELELGVKDSGSPVLSSTTTLSLTLTVSNNTSKIFKTPSKTTTESSNGLQSSVMIAIVIAAVIVSVVIVISISICIVHRLKQTDSNYDSSVDMYHTVTPTLSVQSKYIFDPTCVPPGVQYAMERNLKKSQQPSVDTEEFHYRTTASDRWDHSVLRPHAQMFVSREESMSPGYRELNGTDRFSERSTLSSHIDSGHRWSVGSAGHYEELPDLRHYQSDHTWNRRNQTPNTLNRSRGDNNGYQYQPNVDTNTFSYHDQIPLNITGNASDITDQPSSMPMTSQFTSNCQPPLPAVPKVTTLPKVHSISQVPPPSSVQN